jgi:hypothetical protein
MLKFDNMKPNKICLSLAFAVLLLIVCVAQLKAQSSPVLFCDDPDVDQCPIDTPVVLFAIAILFLAVKKIKEAGSTQNTPVKEV